MKVKKNSLAYYIMYKKGDLIVLALTIAMVAWVFISCFQVAYSYGTGDVPDWNIWKLFVSLGR